MILVCAGSIVAQSSVSTAERMNFFIAQIYEKMPYICPVKVLWIRFEAKDQKGTRRESGTVPAAVSSSLPLIVPGAVVLKTATEQRRGILTPLAGH